MSYVRHGKSRSRIKRTENVVALCFDGSGEIVFPVVGKQFALEPHDVVAIGSWKEYLYQKHWSKAAIHLLVF